MIREDFACVRFTKHSCKRTGKVLVRFSVRVKVVKWDESITELAEDCTFVYKKGNENHHRDMIACTRIISESRVC